MSRHTYRAIPFINDVIEQLKSKERTELSPEKQFDKSFDPNLSFFDIVSRDFSIEQDIFNNNKKGIEAFIHNIKGTFTAFHHITRLFDYAIKIRPKQAENLIDLLSELPLEASYHPSATVSLEYGKILFQRGIVKKVDYFKKGEDLGQGEVLEKIFKEDSVDKLIEISSQYDFNPQGKISFNTHKAVCFANESLYKDGWNEFCEITYMQIMAFYGAVKCFKYALIDGSFDESELSKFAIAGGNEEIIHLLEQKDVDFNYCFETSVKYHRNNLSDWLLRNYKCEGFEASQAIRYYNIPAFYFLLQNKILYSDETISIAFKYSIRCGFLSLARYLTCNYIDSKTKYLEKKLLAVACEDEQWDLVRYLIDKHTELNSNYYGSNSLHWAIRKGKLNIVKYLIDKGAQIEERGEYDGTSLYIACRNNKLEVVKYLIENGARKEARDAYSRTPLQIASRKGYLDIVKYLIDKGANIKSRDEFGKTPLHTASRYNKLDIVKCLIDKGANIKAKDKLGRTPLYIAKKKNNNNVVAYLIEHEATIKVNESK